MSPQAAIVVRRHVLDVALNSLRSQLLESGVEIGTTLQQKVLPQCDPYPLVREMVAGVIKKGECHNEFLTTYLHLCQQA